VLELQVSSKTCLFFERTKLSDLIFLKFQCFITGYLSTLASSSALSGGAGITSYLDSVPTYGTRQTGSGMSSYLDSVGTAAPVASSEHVPVAAEPVTSNLASTGSTSPTTTIDTKVSQNGLQTTITITSVTTVVIDDSE